MKYLDGRGLKHFWNKIKNISGAGAPTASTVGIINQLYRDENTNILYVCIAADAENGVYAWVAVSASSSSSSAMIFDIETDGTVLTCAHGKEYQLLYSWYSLRNGKQTGGGTMRCYVNDVLKIIAAVDQSYSLTDDAEIIEGKTYYTLANNMFYAVSSPSAASLSTYYEKNINAFEIGEYLSNGENTVKLALSDAYGNEDALTWSVTAVKLDLSSTFDDSIVRTGDVAYSFTVAGSGRKTIHFVLNGEELTDRRLTINTSGELEWQTLPASLFAHGAHLLEVYATTDAGGIVVKSNSLYYSIIFNDGVSTDTIIASPFVQTTGKQGYLISIPYIVYTPNEQFSTVTLTISCDGEEDIIQELEDVPPSRQMWATRNFPVGRVTFEISSGNAVKSFILDISETVVDVAATTSNLALYYTSKERSNSAADREQWLDGVNGLAAELSGFNFSSDGWLADKNGDVVLRVMGGSSVTIPFCPFAQDMFTNGYAIEIEFSTHDVIDYEAEIIRCVDGELTETADTRRGLLVTAQECLLRSQLTNVEMQFKEDEHLRLSFVIGSTATGHADQNRFIRTYINGVLSGLTQYASTGDNFTQEVPQYITIGSALCGVDIYNIRIYSGTLSSRQVLNNYIADLADVGQQIKLLDENDIYGNDGEPDFAKVLERMPCMTITGEMPPAKGEKRYVSVVYKNEQEPARNFSASNVKIDVQGTSSQYYPRKNWKFTLPDTEYQLRSNSIAESVFCLKADFMESAGAHNTGLAKLIHNTCPAKTPPQETDSRVRTTIDGFPVALWWQKPNEDAPVFQGKYNFNNDKADEPTFGFDRDAYSNCECWEFCDNDDGRCLFTLSEYEELTDEGEYAWLEAFERRFPDDDNIVMSPAQLKVLTDWIVSTNTQAATGAALGGTVVFGGVEYTTDSAAYRLAKFKAEVENYFDKDFLLFYYVVTELFAMVDSRAKNMFLATWNGSKWYPIFYDMDTCFGLSNDGHLIFNYDLESHDLIDGRKAWNGSNSVLWYNVAQAFNEDIRTMYSTLRASAITYDSVLAILDDEQCESVCEAVYNNDAKFKYILPYYEGGEDRMYVAQGNRQAHRKWWLKNRLNYIDSKYNTGDYFADTIVMRLNAQDDFEITPYLDQYIRINYDGRNVYVRGKRNIASALACPEIQGDTTTVIYGASGLASIGDLSGKYLSALDVAKATKLGELKVGSSAAGYENPYLTELTLANNTILTSIDIQNCSGLTAALEASGCLNLRHVYAKGSTISTAILPVGGYVETLELPATVSSLVLREHPNLTDEGFYIAGLDNLTSLRFEKMSGLNATLKELLVNAANLARVRLVGVNWTGENALEDISLLERIMQLKGLNSEGGNQDAPVLTGEIMVNKITQSEIDTLCEFFGLTAADGGLSNASLKITFATAEVRFVNYDGTVIATVEVAGGNAATAPANPTRFGYDFVGWDKDFSNVTEDMIVTAQYVRHLVLYDGAAYADMWTATNGSTSAGLQANTTQSQIFTYSGGEFELFTTDTIRITFGTQSGSYLYVIVGTNTSTGYAPANAMGNITNPDDVNRHSSFNSNIYNCTANSTSGKTYELAIDKAGLYGGTTPFTVWTYGARVNIAKIEIV